MNEISSSFVNAFVYVLATLIPLANPLSVGLFMMAITKNVPNESRLKIARSVTLYSFLLIISSLFAGVFILNFFGISLPVLRLAGGIVVAITGWKLMNEDPNERTKNSEPLTEAQIDSMAFYPLTMPFVVGPGMISICSAIGTTMPPAIPDYAGAICAIITLCILLYLCMRYANLIQRVLGRKGSEAVMKIFCFLLLCIGCQIIWTGLTQLGMDFVVQATHKVLELSK